MNCAKYGRKIIFIAHYFKHELNQKRLISTKINEQLIVTTAIIMEKTILNLIPISFDRLFK